LDCRIALDEMSVTWEEVETLYHEIVAFWRADQDAAEGWYGACRDGRSAPPLLIPNGLPLFFIRPLALDLPRQAR
jgi:hypothetical protein